MIFRAQNSDTRQNRQDIRTRENREVVMRLVIVEFFMVALLACNAPQPTESNPPAAPVVKPEPEKPDEIEAWTFSKEFVKRRLSSPGSADFGGVFKDYQDPKVLVKDLGNGTFRAHGWVDSQNGFGALIRTNWWVTVKSEAEKWIAVKGPFLGDEIEAALREDCTPGCDTKCDTDFPNKKEKGRKAMLKACTLDCIAMCVIESLR
jgi:hypothetical protein